MKGGLIMALKSSDKKLIYFGALLAAVSAAYLLVISPMADNGEVAAKRA